MTRSEGLGERLDAALAPGVVRAEAEGRTAEVEVAEVDRLGARVRAVRVEVPRGDTLGAQAERLPEALRVLPDRVVPVEVDPGLGGAVLRSRPRDVRDGEFFEARADGRSLTLGRRRAGPEGREDVPFTLTREQLRRLVDDVGDALAPPGGADGEDGPG